MCKSCPSHVKYTAPKLLEQLAKPLVPNEQDIWQTDGMPMTAGRAEETLLAGIRD